MFIVNKPKFLKTIETIELNERENFQLQILLRSNPISNSIRMNRIMRKISTSKHDDADNNLQLDRLLIANQRSDFLLENLKWENIQDYLELIPSQWHWQLSVDNHSILIDMYNVTRNDYGLYVLRAENSIGYSLMFIRLFIRTISSIDKIRVVVPRKTSVMTNTTNQSSTINHRIQMDNSTAIEIIELIENNDRNFRIECDVNDGNPSSIIRWTKQFFSEHLQRLQIHNIRHQHQQSKSINYWPLSNDHYHYHHTQHHSVDIPYLYDDMNADDDDYNFLINSNLHSSDMFIDWSRSNVTQTVLSKKNSKQIANSAANNHHQQQHPNYSHYNNNNNSLSIHSELAINQVNFVDSGIYTCHTMNDSRSIAIRIRHRPRIFVPYNLRKIAANNGEQQSVKFVCSALAYPTNVYFNWTRFTTVNDDDDDDDDHNNNNNNNADSDEIPKKQQQQTSMMLINSDKYRVIFPSSSESSSTSSALETEMIIKNYHHTSELIIRHLDNNDYGIYECMVNNEFGNDHQRFELVRKSYPESPKNLQILNLTHQQAFLRWNPGFNYGHEQSFTIRLWSTKHSLTSDDEFSGYVDGHDDDDRIDPKQPNDGRIFANISNNYFQLNNLEPNTHYRLLLWAKNHLGRSRKSLRKTFHTLSILQYQQQQQQQQMQNFRNKNRHHQQQPTNPLYAASADEQSLNGRLIILNDNGVIGGGNGDTAASQSSTIGGHRSQNRRLAMVVGEDFVELTILMGGLIIILAIISFIMIIFIYWRKRNHHQQQQQQQHQSSNNNNNKINDKINESQQQQQQQLPENGYNQHHHLTNHNSNNNDRSKTKLMMMMNQNEFQPSISVDANNSAAAAAATTTYHLIKTTTNDGDNNICNELMAASSTPMATTPSSSSIAMNDYVNVIDDYNNESNGHYLAITSNDHHHHHHHQQLQQQQRYEFPYELTTINDSQSSNDHHHHSYNHNHHSHHNQQHGHLIQSSSESESSSSFDKQLQYVLSHQQITNVHLLPDTLEQLTIDSSTSPQPQQPLSSIASLSSSSLLSHMTITDPIMATAGTYQISFTPIHYGDNDNNNEDGSANYEIQPAINSANAAAATIYSGMESGQHCHDYRLNTIISSESMILTPSTSTIVTTTAATKTTTPKVSFMEPNIYINNDNNNYRSSLSSTTATKRVQIIQSLPVLSSSTTTTTAAATTTISSIINPSSLATLNEDDEI
ncbi:plasma membrane cell adhesion molecule [Dermatophagoides farinae]|uniref:Plasma membrane cell adhesion molecule n=1 Tax=Dermatophagoides farinae TaxID=6954 RepID=A0A922I8Z0_DERFA|nr:plasma membrane cell adhesion molecule [Dermatophagoides farinae]